MKHPPLLLVTCCLAHLIVVLDSSILTVAPHTATDLNMSPGHLPWVVDALAIPIAGLLLFSGELSDRYGARPLFFTGTTILMTPVLPKG